MEELVKFLKAASRLSIAVVAFDASVISKFAKLLLPPLVTRLNPPDGGYSNSAATNAIAP